MSAVKFNYPTYKLFERPIIIDADAIESPETVTLRYEEEAAARANGGDLRGDSPPGLLGIDACPKTEPPPMHSFDSSRPYQDTQYQYSGQAFAAQQTENAAAAAAQLNHLAFAANSSASQYMSPVVPTLTSYQPTSGVFGTKVVLKISATYDLIAVTSHFFLAFGSHKSPAHAIRDANDSSGLGYVVSGDAPQLEDTRVLSGNVPISLLIESPDGQTLANIDVGTFTYDTQAVGAEGSHESGTRRPSIKSHADEAQQQHEQQQQQHERTNSPKIEPQPEPDHLNDAASAATNTYPYAPATHSSYDATGYPNNPSNTSMLSTYHRPSYGADYPRPPSLLKTPSWVTQYGPPLTSPRSPPSIHHATVQRPSVTALPIPTASAPQLIRTSTLQATTSSSGASINPYAIYTTKAVLKINGDLESMASGWTAEECENGRRLVLFSKKQQGSTLSTTFKPVSISERPPNSICISCIYWNEKRECFVTSVDTISLLEQLVVAPNRFSIEEKNRIRRNLEGFKPLTVSKAKPESEEFFKTIMGFPNPKPRNIEKDVKVFPWKILGPALKKIISKYSASPSSSSGLHHPAPSFHPSSGPSALLTPVSSTSPGLYGPQTPTIADTSYSHHHDSQTMASPRSLSGVPPPPSWAPYTGRTLSPSLKSHSPQGIRIPSLPSYANHHHSSAHHGYGIASSRWDTNGYGEAPSTPAYASHHHSSHVYGTSAAYGASAHHRD
ncbi:hypothetical protein F5B22DRAFT_649574 [Xylaria bambusicola]|uniref:uncharacterized protein n=1 Tax=Xylaria bambusicola TaxID=326684 RepID=UPI002008E17E|nr:uncharacterized protein F5B22DRAFT_649574 [Xylaria bambusicola]KAI0508873.1 hypothetical protein F5B22DRAFT_649574 [Xylaria bambusicola]